MLGRGGVALVAPAARLGVVEGVVGVGTAPEGGLLLHDRDLPLEDGVALGGLATTAGGGGWCGEAIMGGGG